MSQPPLPQLIRHPGLGRRQPLIIHHWSLARHRNSPINNGEKTIRHDVRARLKQPARGQPRGQTRSLHQIIIHKTLQIRRSHQPPIHAHTCVQSTSNSHRNPLLRQKISNRQRTTHTTQRRHLQHRHITGTTTSHLERILRAPNRLIRRNLHKHTHPRKSRTQLRQLINRRTRLLHILQRTKTTHSLGSLLYRPRTIGIHTNLHNHIAGSTIFTHSRNPRDVIIHTPLLPRAISHLHLHSPAPREAIQHRSHLFRRDRWNRRVDLHRITLYSRQTHMRLLNPGSQPRSGLLRLILLKRGKLSPPRRPLNQHGLTHINPAETHRQRHPHHSNIQAIGLADTVKVDGSNRIDHRGIKSHIGIHATILPHTPPIAPHHNPTTAVG